MSESTSHDFVSSYMDFTKGQEATDRIHRWVALSVIAGALERKVWLHRGHYTLFPNLYTFIIGPSGVVRKSTSTAIGVDMLREIDTIRIMSERVTAASLIKQLADSQKNFDYKGFAVKQCPTFTYASELNVFLNEIFGSISELLTTFYDCVPNDSSKSWKYQTIGGGVTNIYGPCLNLLGASTPTWLVRAIPASEMEGGFASRVIYVVEDTSRRAIAFPDGETKAEDYELHRRRLVDNLKRIHNLVGPMFVTPEFRAQGQLWYESHQKSQRSNTDLRFSGYYGRKFDTVLKVAMLLSVSESSDLIIDTRHFEQSLALLQDIESRMFDAFGSHGENPNSTLMNKIWSILKNEKRMTLSRLMNMLHRDAGHERVCLVVDNLAFMHRVTKVNDQRAGDVYITAVQPELPL